MEVYRICSVQQVVLIDVSCRQACILTDCYASQVNVCVALHKLAVQGVRQRRGNGRPGLRQRGHRRHGRVRPSVGDGIGQPAEVFVGVEEHDWLGGRQTNTGNST